jgi:hypothetical protein
MIFLESQFRILPLNSRFFSEKSITFGKLNSIPVLLKHVLSGRFLGIDPKSKKLILGGDYSDELKGLKQRTGEINRMFKEKRMQYDRVMKNVNEISKKDIPFINEYEIDLFGKVLKDDDLIKPEIESDYHKAFLLSHTFILEKISTDENLKLRNSTFFKIRTFSNKYLK